MGKRKYHQIEKSEEKLARNEAKSEKEGEDFSKRKKSKSRERQGHIYQRKRRKLQDDNSNEKMIIKNQRPDIKIVNEKRSSKMVSALKSIKSKLKSPKIEKEEHAKRKITEDILNDLTFEEGYTDSEGSDCNQILASDSLSTYWIILMRYRNWETETACLGRMQGEHSTTMNAIMNYVMLSEISF